MSWLEVRVQIKEPQLEALEDALMTLGALAVTLTDNKDNPILEPPAGQTPLWPTMTVTALFTSATAIEPITTTLTQLEFIGHATAIGFSRLKDQNWVRSWMDRFTTMRFGKNLWIVPTTTAESEQPDDADATIIYLDPGLAFGTGTHPTTALCLEWIDGQNFEGKSVIDYGCGSGILAIAAALKGAQKVYAIDNDPQAILSTNENASRNKVTNRLSSGLPGSPLPQVDFVFANILAQPLVAMAAQLSGYLRPAGKLVLSGILEDQTKAVQAAYVPFVQHIKINTQLEWVRLSAEKIIGE